MRRPLVAGNWKMNLDLAAATQLAAEVAGAQRAPELAGVDVTICPAFVHLAPISAVLAGSAVSLGAQDVYHEENGAFTGEVSVAMLRDVGVRQVIVGHSERRHTIGRGEDDRMINLKVRAVLAGGLAPILCVGETLAEREAGRTLDVLTFQVRAGLVGVSDGGALTLAYEPVWAIGTGRNATPGQAQEAHVHIRAELRQLVGSSADRVRVLYGGSVKPDNARDLFSQADVDGGLIGGASLKADAFGAIVRAALASGR